MSPQISAKSIGAKLRPQQASQDSGPRKCLRFKALNFDSLQLGLKVFFFIKPALLLGHQRAGSWLNPQEMRREVLDVENPLLLLHRASGKRHGITACYDCDYWLDLAPTLKHLVYKFLFVQIYVYGCIQT